MNKTICIIICILAATIPVAAKENVRLLLTSNLEGNFLPQTNNQEKTDHLIMLGQSILMESRIRKHIYLDLGNAFYPGPLSRYSFGSVMMDFFNQFDCKASIISSKDVQLGAHSLLFLDKKNKTSLLSCNITKENKTIFQPYYQHQSGMYQLVFIGLSSKKTLPDVAEKNIYDLSIKDHEKSLAETLASIPANKNTRIIILSGLPYKENIELMTQFKRIDLLISGGDNKGSLFNTKLARVVTDDGRSIMSLSHNAGYYLVDLIIDDDIRIVNVQTKTASFHETHNDLYTSFINRLTRWKEHFLKDNNKTLATVPKETLIDSKRIANLLRDRYNAEIAIIYPNAFAPLTAKGPLQLLDIFAASRDNYQIFTFKLTGEDLTALEKYYPLYTMTGLTDKKIQNYAVKPKELYKIVSTQTTHNIFESILNKPVPYVNVWKNISETIIDDFKDDKIILKDDYNYLERRFRTMVDCSFAYFFERSEITKGKTVETPPGNPEKSYEKWGLESKIDFTLYNDLHKFILTPYMYYSKENHIYLQNLLRGTLYYYLNVSSIFKPYHKSQIDSVVYEIEDNRPTFVRETIGANFEFLYFSGSLGIGFEKQIYDYERNAIYGLESIIKIQIKFLKYFEYNLNFDSFIAAGKIEEAAEKKPHIRTEITNSLAFLVTDLVQFSMKYKYFYFYSMEYKEKYRNSQFITSIDLKTNFKFF